MLTLTQIGALIGLLMAFGVDQPTINNVQGILTSQEPSHIQMETPAVGSPASKETPEQKLEALRAQAEQLFKEQTVLIEARNEEIRNMKAGSQNRSAIYAKYSPDLEPLALEIRRLQKEIEALYYSINSKGK